MSATRRSSRLISASTQNGSSDNGDSCASVESRRKRGMDATKTTRGSAKRVKTAPNPSSNPTTKTTNKKIAATKKTRTTPVSTSTSKKKKSTPKKKGETTKAPSSTTTKTTTKKQASSAGRKQPYATRGSNKKIKTAPKTNVKNTNKKKGSVEGSKVDKTLSRAFEERVRKQGFKLLCGTDEAGRGPLCGPVVAAACIIPPHIIIEGVNDSKQVKEQDREAIYEQLTTHPDIIWAASVVDNKRIDEINILQASMEAMAKSVKALSIQPDYVFVDGPRCPTQFSEALSREPVVKGDSKCYLIAAASIIAKVTRDRIMYDLDAKYPEYNLKQHKGYPTREHMAICHKLGPSPFHRLTFAPIKHMDLSRYKL